MCNNIALAGFRIPEWQDYKQAFQENGPWDSKIEKPEAWGTYRRYETGWATTSDSPAAVQAVMDHPQGWDTSTGKQEIWSTVIDNYYPNDDQAIPTFREAPHGPVADPDLFEDDNSFLATTGRRIPVYFHNEHRQLPWCRELWPVPRIEMNPEDAERIGVEQGDWVWIETKEHKIREVRRPVPRHRTRCGEPGAPVVVPRAEAGRQGLRAVRRELLASDKDAQDPHHRHRRTCALTA